LTGTAPGVETIREELMLLMLLQFLERGMRNEKNENNTKGRKETHHFATF